MELLGPGAEAIASFVPSWYGVAAAAALISLLLGSGAAVMLHVIQYFGFRVSNVSEGNQRLLGPRKTLRVAFH